MNETGSIYEVWITLWSNKEKAQVKKLAGTFDTYLCARIFKLAYDERFHTDCKIVEYKRQIAE